MSDEPEDPFDRLGADPDREGDPFERLGDDEDPADDATADDGTGDDGAAGDGAAGSGTGGDDPADAEPGAAAPSGDAPITDPFSSPDEGGTASTGESHHPDPQDDGERASGAGVRSGSDPFSDVETREGDPFDGPTGAFERVDVGELDPDTVWDDITAEESRDDNPPTIDESRYAEVSKHAYCEGCEFFSAPPDVACSHDTAEIVEFVDVETVRLLDCPVVAQRREIEDGN